VELKMKKTLLIFAVILISVVSCNVKQNTGSELFPQDDGKVIAEFDGIKITDKYLASYLKDLNPYLKSRYNTPEKKEELITKIVEGELIARKAIKDGALKDKALISKIKSTIARYYSGTKMKTDIEHNLKVTDDEMKKYFEENKDKYNQPEKIKASHILIKAEGDNKDKARKTAENVLKEVKAKAKDPRSFGKLVKKYSEDKGSKRRGGDLGYFARTEEGGKMVKPFSDAAFALKTVGDISEIVESQFGFHIIKLTGKRDKVVKAFDDVKKSIEQTLKSEKRKDGFQNRIDTIKKELGFKLDKEAAQAIDLGIPEEVNQSAKTFDKKGPKSKIDPARVKKIQEMIKKRNKAKKDKPAKKQ
jgi:peptidyl-prolyl cis-trans isomerase C